jgi:HAE1 family hydrophobic/amphiphilic exporter-1
MTKFSVRKPFTVLVAVVMVFALGLASMRGMTPELLPNIELPYILTITSYPGASPEKVEAEVSKPLEQSFSTLTGLESIQSRSSENVSIVILEFTDSTDLAAVSLDLLQKIQQVEGAWDDIIATPIILKMNPDMLPVMIAAVEKDGADTTELSRFMGDTLQNRLEGINGVASIDVSGLRVDQVNVVLRQEKILELNARIAEAVGAELDKKADELRNTQSELEGTLADLEGKGAQLTAGAEQLAAKIGEGSAGLSSSWADLILGLQTQKAMLDDLKGRLAGLVAEEQKARDAAAAIGMPLPPQVEEQFASARSQLEGGIAQLEGGIATLEGLKGTLASAQGTLDATAISTLFGLSSGAGGLAAGQAQVRAALTQIESGLKQLEDARKAALEKADLSTALSMATVSGILQAQNFSMPAGYVHQGYDDYLVRVGDEIASLDELKGLVLLDPGIEGIGAVHLDEVADVFMSDNIAEIYAKINGHDGILLSFNKQSEHSTTEVTDGILAKFSELSSLYPGLRFTPLMNQGDYIYRVINGITSDLLWGALFAVIILLLFLRDLRPTFITLCAIPISLVFALVAMYFSGVTINIISLAGLAIAVGRLVDDSVVVIENIFRLRAKGYSPVRAAVNGAGQVAGAIVASTLTTICVFLPIVFVQGLTRQLFTDFALTFAFALLASLAIALTLVPAMAAGMFKKMEPREHKWLDKAIALYDRALSWTLRFKPVVLVFALVLLVASTAAVLTRGFAYMPEGSSGQLTVSLSIPKASDAEMRKVADDASARVLAVEGVETVGAMAGGSGLGTGASSGLMSLMGGGGGSLESTSMYVLLDSSANIGRVTEDIKAALEGIEASAEVSSSSMSASMLGGSGITVNIHGQDMQDLMDAAAAIGRQAASVEGVAEVDNGLESAATQLHFTIDREKAAKHGLTTAQAYQLVASALSTQRSATQVSFESLGYDVVVVNESHADGALSPELLRNLELTVTKRDGTVEKVALSEISTLSQSQTLPSVQRSNQQRVLPVAISVAEGHNVTLVTADVERALSGVSLPDGVTIDVSGENATIMEAFNELGMMLVLGLLLVYLIMVAQFQSLKSPFIIMFTVPLAFTGGMLALLVTGKVLSVISLIGFAMLIGIIVSNAIVLVDYINRLRRDGAERRAAIHEAAATRMRPILMTALATIFALVVMALGIGRGSEMMQPLAIVCIGGLVYGTLMTLFVIPVIYDLLNRRELRVVNEEDMAAVEE